MRIKIQCPAKINLTLKIINKREDGFHNIESIMQTIDLYDYLTIDVEPSDKFEIILSGNNNEIPYNEKNLVHKAAKLFFDSLKCHSEAKNYEILRCAQNDETTEESHNNYKTTIYIEKNIPVAAGLAGGSTDGAGTLYGLNEIFKQPLNKDQLHKLCSQLGSDLNVCLEGGRLLCKGRGEIIEPVDFEDFDVSLIKPKNLGISAKDAYAKFALKKNLHNTNAGELKSKKDNSPLLQHSLAGEGAVVDELANHAGEVMNRNSFSNDLEWAIIDDYKELQIIKKLYPDSMMSGSGSTYFRTDGTFDPLDGYEIYNNHKAINFGVKRV